MATNPSRSLAQIEEAAAAGGTAARLVETLKPYKELLTIFTTVAVSAYFSFVGPDASAFHGAFVVDGFVRFIKAAILWSSFACILMAQRFFADENVVHFELPVLMLLATCGMSLMVSAQSFISLYLGLELQSLALYVVAAFARPGP